MYKFTTESGSTYEVNETDKMIRRLAGNTDPTKRQGKDGEWKKYEEILVAVGSSAIIMWSKLSTSKSIPATQTSAVVSVTKRLI